MRFITKKNRSIPSRSSSDWRKYIENNVEIFPQPFKFGAFIRYEYALQATAMAQTDVVFELIEKIKNIEERNAPHAHGYRSGKEVKEIAITELHKYLDTLKSYGI